MMTNYNYDDLPLWSAPFGLALLETVRIKRGINVLDIGSGGGFPMLELAARMGRSSMVYGLDPLEESVGLITAKKESRSIEYARIIRGVAEDIPFPDEYFGLIVSNNGLNNVADQEKALAECYRVADKEAQMVLTMNLPHTFFEFYTVYEEVLAEAGLQKYVDGMHRHIDARRKPVEYTRDRILEAGFGIRSISVDGFKMKFAEGKAFFSHPLIRTAFLGPWQEVVPEDSRPEVFAAISAELDRIAEVEGELVMSVPFACYDCYRPGK